MARVYSPGNRLNGDESNHFILNDMFEFRVLHKNCNFFLSVSLRPTSAVTREHVTNLYHVRGHEISQPMCCNKSLLFNGGNLVTSLLLNRLSIRSFRVSAIFVSSTNKKYGTFIFKWGGCYRPSIVLIGPSTGKVFA